MSRHVTLKSAGLGATLIFSSLLVATLAVKFYRTSSGNECQYSTTDKTTHIQNPNKPLDSSVNSSEIIVWGRMIKQKQNDLEIKVSEILRGNIESDPIYVKSTACTSLSEGRLEVFLLSYDDNQLWLDPSYEKGRLTPSSVKRYLSGASSGYQAPTLEQLRQLVDKSDSVIDGSIIPDEGGLTGNILKIDRILKSSSDSPRANDRIEVPNGGSEYDLSNSRVNGIFFLTRAKSGWALESQSVPYIDTEDLKALGLK